MENSALARVPTVLYVEDEEYDMYFMRLAFQRPGLGLDLRGVPDGREAIDYLAGYRHYADREEHPLPSMILLDLNLPRISGFEVLNWVRRQPEFKALPVVVFSSSKRHEDKQKAQELGASEYVEKPSSALQFRDIVQQLKQRWLSDPGTAGKRILFPLFFLAFVVHLVASFVRWPWQK